MLLLSTYVFVWWETFHTSYTHLLKYLTDSPKKYD